MQLNQLILKFIWKRKCALITKEILTKYVNEKGHPHLY